MTTTSTAVVPTAHAGRYLRQLCSHWSHRFSVTFDERHGSVPFENGATGTVDASDDALTVRLDAPDADALRRMQGVLAEHLDRFAFREAPLRFDWR